MWMFSHELYAFSLSPNYIEDICFCENNEFKLSNTYIKEPILLAMCFVVRKFQWKRSP